MMFVICKSVLRTHHAKGFIVDSFPVAACQNNKIFRCRLFQSHKFRGYTASQKSYFLGMKVHMIVTLEGLPVEFLITPGSTADVKVLKMFQFDLEKGSKVYGDGAVVPHFEAELEDALGIKLVPKRKKNSRKKHSKEDERILKHHRGRIETTFSGVVALMPRSIKATTPRGFILKLIFFILGYTVNRLIKIS